MSGLSLPVSQVRAEWLKFIPPEGRDLRSVFPPIGADDWLRYRRTGDRAHYESLVAERHRLLSAAVLEAGASGSPLAVERVVEGVRVFCDQASWCWPAHAADGASREGLPDADHPFLDLGAGEVAAQLSWTDHLVGDLAEEISPGIRQRIRDEVRHRVFRPFLERHDWHWLGLDGDVHNWLPWIAGNVLTAAIALEDDQTCRAELIEASRACLLRYADALPSDGGVDEGFGYWWNGACRAIEAFEILASESGGDDWREHPSLRATVQFPSDMQLGGGWWVNIADGSARPDTDLAWPSLFRMGRALGDRRAQALALSRRTGSTTSEIRRLGRLVLELADEQWWAAPSTTPEPRREAWYPSVQVLVARQEAGEFRGLTLAAKGGHNGEHHNHNDVGSFVVALDGVPIVIDVGRPTYTAATFSEERYSLWTMQSSWHNVPLLAGLQQCQGTTFAAREVEVSLTETAVELRLDLQAAYPYTGIDRWRRHLTLDRSTGAVICTDRWSAVGPLDEPSTNVLVIAGTVLEASAHHVVVRPVGGGTRCLLVQSDDALQLERRDLDDPSLVRVWGSPIHRVEIDLGTASRGRTTLSFQVVSPGDWSARGDSPLPIAG